MLPTVHTECPEEVHLAGGERVHVCYMLEVGVNSAVNDGEEFCWVKKVEN